MRYERNKTVQRSADYHSKQCQLYKGPNNVIRENTMSVNYGAVEFIK